MAELMYDLMGLLACKAEADNRLIVHWREYDLTPKLLMVKLTAEQINDIALKYREIAEILMANEREMCNRDLW